MSIVIAGDRSGTGKTTVTTALLAALRKQNRRVQSFKVGPDYIDPMFHSAITGRPCYNLDPVLTSNRYVQESFQRRCADADYAVVEGVMGLFDGATGIDDTASTAHIARLLNLPVVLVVDCGRMARSLAALVHGYKTFNPAIEIAGVVLNRVGSDRHLELLKAALDAIDMPIFGAFHREKDIQLPSRHLGLVPTEEVSEFSQIATRLAEIGERCFDWEQLEGWLKTEHIKYKESPVTQEKRVEIAIARDEAFSFYYPDNLEALKESGAELIYWSPIKDNSLPNADGLYFGGGFPEVFAAALSENALMRIAVKQAIEQGIPTYAECGGLMYLSEVLTDLEGKDWSMVGTIPQAVRMERRLTLGYRRATATSDGPLMAAGETIVGHEFHKSGAYASSPNSPSAYRTKRYWGGTESPQAEGYVTPSLHASYVHLNWSDRPNIAARFVQQCAEYKLRQATANGAIASSQSV